MTPTADFADQSLVFRVAASAARLGLRAQPARVADAVGQRGGAGGEVDRAHARRRSSACSARVGGWWPRSEALEQYDLFSLFLPEWRHVRSLPQRNAFHIYTVDRHLLTTVANATELVRDVSRPDLLLVGALLHDIGKGYPGDHTVVGMDLVERILPRMGFSDEDAAVILSLVEHHLSAAGDGHPSRPQRSAHVVQRRGGRGRCTAAGAAARPHRGRQSGDGSVGVVGVEGAAHRSARRGCRRAVHRRAQGRSSRPTRGGGSTSWSTRCAWTVGCTWRANRWASCSVLARGHDRPARFVRPRRRHVGHARCRHRRRRCVDQPRRHRRGGVRHRAATRRRTELHQDPQ